MSKEKIYVVTDPCGFDHCIDLMNIFGIPWENVPSYLIEKIPPQCLQNTIALKEDGTLLEKTVVYVGPCKDPKVKTGDSFMFKGLTIYV